MVRVLTLSGHVHLVRPSRPVSSKIVGTLQGKGGGAY